MAKKCTLTEQEIVEGLRDAAQRVRDKIFHCLYEDKEIWDDFCRFVRTDKEFWRYMGIQFAKPLFLKKLREEDIREAYDDTWMLFLNKVQQGKYQPQAGKTWRHYFMVLAQSVWRKFNRESQKNKDVDLKADVSDINVEPLEMSAATQDETTSIEQEAEKSRSLKSEFESLGETGRHGWEIYWLLLQGHNYSEVADHLGIEEATARKRKSDCDQLFYKKKGIKLPDMPAFKQFFKAYGQRERPKDDPWD